MIMTVLIYCAAIAILLCFSAFFSGSEIAFSAVNEARLEANHSPGAKQANFIHQNFDKALSAILIGNNLVNISSSSVATLLALILVGESASRSAQDMASSAASVALTVFVLIFGETVPKIMAKRNPLGFAVAVSRPLRLIMVILTPFTAVITKLVTLITSPLKGEKLDEDEEAEVAREELMDLIESSEDEGIIDEGESELLQNALDFSEISVQEVMTPRVDILALEIDDDEKRQKRIIENSPFSRLPVYDEQREQVIGVLHLNHYYRALLSEDKPDLRKLLIEPCFVYKTVKLPAALSLMRQKQTHIAIVTDEYGSTIGMVTMEDVLEQIVGDIWGEDDETLRDVVQRGEHRYDIDADIPISEFCDLLDIDPEDLDTESVTAGGWTLEMFGVFPKAGDSFEYKNITVTVLKMDNLRVDRLLAVKKR